MKFKVLKGSETFAKFEALKEKIKAVHEAAIEVVKQLGSTRYCRHPNRLAGGVGAVIFDKKPEGWKTLDPIRGLYYPKATNKKTLALVDALPTVKYDELNNIIGYKAPQWITEDDGKCYMVQTFQVTFGTNEVLIRIHPKTKFEPIPDMIEILESEYLRLEKEIKSHQN